MVCRRYRPRQPRSSPVWQVFRQHWPAYLLRQEAGISAKHGPLAAQVPSAVAAFLRCGDLHAGFTRLRCPECEHEYLLAFTCKQRGLCASCHQRRTLVEAAFIADEVCAAVPHRHLVLTVPRLLRGHFAGRPARLGELALAARDAITAWLRERTGCPAGQPGLVMVVQTFGDFLLWHVPAKGVPSVRYYGWYSNKSRGLRRKATAASTTAPAEPKPPARRRRVRWRELIRQVWGADPLRCPLCSGFLRPIEWIETPTAIRAFLEPLGLYESTTGPPAQAPPIDAAALIEAVTGEAYPAGPQPEPKWLEHPRIKTDPLYYRQWMLPPAPADHDECWQPDAEADFDQAGFELPPWRAPATDPGQGSLFPEYAAQSDSSADEPVFVLTGRQSEPEDDYIQPDAPDDVRP